MKLVVLIDNKTKNEWIPEWGLSIWIEYEGHKFLLDTGASGDFARNAENMGLDLKEIEYGILSHAHYDHADGMNVFFKQNNMAFFYLRKGTEENCYGKKRVFFHYIGIKKGLLNIWKDRVCFVDGFFNLLPDVYLIPHAEPSVLGTKNSLYKKQGRKMIPDDLLHEQSLVFDTPNGLVILNSCSHGGVDTIIREVQRAFPEKLIYAYIGGFHLFRTSPDEVRKLAEKINKTNIQKIFTGHCTGDCAFEVLKQELSCEIKQMYTGMQIIL